MGFTREIIERRVLPAVGVYVGASWVVVEILDRLVERYFLSPYLTDMVFWGLFSLLPAVVLLAWTHGRPGKDRATRAEKVGIPINVIATIGLLLTVFGDKDMSATADMVTMANELGQEEVHYVPRESYRRRIAVFFWDRSGEGPELDWLQYGVTELLTQDLQQNPFLLVASPWDTRRVNFYDEVKQAGFDDGLAVPLALKRDIADDANFDYFIDGTISREDQQFRLTARVWETDSLEMMGELRVQGWDLMSSMDDLSEDVRRLLDTPPGRGDLPLVETYGESQDALRHYIGARNAILFENDRISANQGFDRALQADPHFVLAWFMKSLSQWEQGDAAGAQEALEEAQKLSYRLPERDQVLVKMLTYRMGGEQDKLETLLRMQTRIEGDAASYNSLAAFLMYSGELEEAKEYFRRQMEIDSSSTGALLHLARLERATGDIDAAISHALEYIDTEPDDLVPHILLGDLLLESGDMDAARDSYERAQILEDPPQTATLKLALLAIRQGEWTQARNLIEEARELAASPAHAIAVLQVEAYLESRLGRIEKSIERVEQQVEFSRQVLTPVEQVFTYNVPVIDANIMLGRIDAAEGALAEAKQALNPPLDQFLSFSEVRVAAYQGDFEAARVALETGIAVIDHFKADFMAFMVPMTEAKLMEEEGNYSRAGRLYRDAIQKLNRSIVGSGMQDGHSLLYGSCAKSHVRAGELDVAQSVLDYAFRRDSAEPSLWVARAMLQEANGSRHMALASVNYALAIWADADPDYQDYREALALRQKLEKHQE
ncbi:MAG: hypothetical protein V2I48_14055 [Xanthomonadales bacterium]|nr:hypothetical protein [Xanthomonadales bacterium]